jgi:hypothetical protein
MFCFKSNSNKRRNLSTDDLQTQLHLSLPKLHPSNRPYAIVKPETELKSLIGRFSLWKKAYELIFWGLV